jgi:hypothetical protein
MLYVDFLNILYKLEINRTFIEQLKKLSIKKDKKMYILFTWKIP